MKFLNYILKTSYTSHESSQKKRWCLKESSCYYYNLLLKYENQSRLKKDTTDTFENFETKIKYVEKNH